MMLKISVVILFSRTWIEKKMYACAVPLLVSMNTIRRIFFSTDNDYEHHKGQGKASA